MESDLNAAESLFSSTPPNRSGWDMTWGRAWTYLHGVSVLLFKSWKIRPGETSILLTTAPSPKAFFEA